MDFEDITTNYYIFFMMQKFSNVNVYFMNFKDDKNRGILKPKDMVSGHFKKILRADL